MSSSSGTRQHPGLAIFPPKWRILWKKHVSDRWQMSMTELRVWSQKIDLELLCVGFWFSSQKFKSELNMNKLPKTCCNFGRRESFTRFQFVGRSRTVVLEVVLLVNCPSFPIGVLFFGYWKGWYQWDFQGTPNNGTADSPYYSLQFPWKGEFAQANFLGNSSSPDCSSSSSSLTLEQLKAKSSNSRTRFWRPQRVSPVGEFEGLLDQQGLNAAGEEHQFRIAVDWHGVDWSSMTSMTPPRTSGCISWVFVKLPITESGPILGSPWNHTLMVSTWGKRRGIPAFPHQSATQNFKKKLFAQQCKPGKLTNVPWTKIVGLEDVCLLSFWNEAESFLGSRSTFVGFSGRW